jgi:hypothetical protein
MIALIKKFWETTPIQVGSATPRGLPRRDSKGYSDVYHNNRISPPVGSLRMPPSRKFADLVIIEINSLVF